MYQARHPRKNPVQIASLIIEHTICRRDLCDLCVIYDATGPKVFVDVPRD